MKGALKEYGRTKIRTFTVRNANRHSHFGKLNTLLPQGQSAKCLPWCLPKGAENICPQRNLHTDVYSSFIHSALLPTLLKQPSRSFSKWMNKLVHIDNEILLNTKQKWAVKPWKGMEEWTLKAYYYVKQDDLKTLHTMILTIWCSSRRQ